MSTFRGSVHTTLFPAGTQIPTSLYFNEDFIIQNTNQKIIEIPICVSNVFKILTVIRLNLDNIDNIKKGDKVKIEYRIDENKLLLVQVDILGHKLQPEYVNPFANQSLSNTDRIVLEAERKMNEERYYTSGNPSIDSLYDLLKAYKKAKKYQKCAEILQAIKAKKFDTDLSTNICYYYSRANNRYKSLEWAKYAYSESKTATTCFNLALEKGNSKEYEKLMEECIKIDDNAYYAYIHYANSLITKDKKRADELMQKGFEGYYQEMKKGTISTNDISRLRNASNYLGKMEVVKEIDKYQAKLDEEEMWFSEDNLLIKKENNLIG